MSDWIEKDGKKYFEEGYLKLANKNASRRGETVASMKAAIYEVFEVLDDKLGDTDPFVPEEFTDEDIRVEMPLFWCCRRLGQFITRQDSKKITKSS